MKSSFVANISTRYAPFYFQKICGSRNTMPSIEEWGDNPPRFKKNDDDILAWNLKDIH